ncbi:HAMP domain-containing histidine kinase [Macrococcoides caseolyticum]|uniref:sensor histidine kinase n=1 Tax=Macrococcoides caseolyticum TaxID=69966 RepID=UPI001C5DB79D|nr:HAMP domain-containing sensor histidine kinase [Macrococcus caseolyticus]QYA39795.1 HAMP domain-containing histidine kinase [Macrococcus caseolyticus]
MGIAFIVITLVCIASLVLNAMYHYDLKHIAQQLTEVSHQVHTNERIRTETHLKRVNDVTDGINGLIDKQISERVHYQKDLQAQKEEWANVSHDLRTPLTSLRGYMEVIQKEAITEAECTHYLTIMERKIDDLIERINTFYDVSLIESESIQLEREYIAINSIINDVLLLYFREIEHKDLDIQITETTHEIYIDKQATLRIINNVIVNALRFAKRYIHIHYEQSGDQLTVTIENDTKETVTNPVRLFERSVMGDSSRQGTHNGLGLYIVKKLMELQDGTAHIEVDDEAFKMKLVFEG